MTDSKSANKAIGRAIVWGGVIILVGLALYEFRARSTYQKSYDKVIEAFDAAKEGDVPLTEQEVSILVNGYSKKETENSLTPNHVSASRLDKYGFRSLLGGARELYVYYGPVEQDDKILGVVAVRDKPLVPENN